MTPSIVFIKHGSFSHFNDNVLNILIQHFPQYKVEVIDGHALLKKNPVVLCFNAVATLMEYSRDLIRHRFDKKRALWCFFNTYYITEALARMIADKMRKIDCVFSFQTQSIYVPTVDGIPHFLYTDATVLSNTYYGDVTVDDLLPPWRLARERMTYQNAAAVFTMSSNITKSMIEQYGCDPHRVVCVYVGHSAQVMDETSERNYRSKNILFVGRDWKRKGGPVLVEAFEAVLKAHPDARLTIVGCSPTIALPNCSVQGTVPLTDVHEYYEEASIFALPTEREPFGNVLLEAMAHKLPVVATNISAIPDFVLPGVNGYLVEPAQSDALAECLIGLLNDPEQCRYLGVNGRRLVLERYSWSQVGQRMTEVIKPIICSERYAR